MIDFFKKMFSEGGPDYEPSSGRMISAACTLASICWISHIVYHAHALPDVATLGGTTAFSVAHYAANRVTNIGK